MIPVKDLDETVARIIKNSNKGILAADESVGTIGKRFAKNSIESTYESRRLYRELLFSTPSIEKYISAIILSDETIHQSASDGTPFVKLLEEKNIVPGIKVDKGTIPLAFFSGESVTEGLDGLRDRLNEYKKIGAKFAKWRVVIKIGKETPSEYCIATNAQILSRYASICQEHGIVPIVEPEVLMDGNHSLEQCKNASVKTLETVFHFLHKAHTFLEFIILKPNMVLPGKEFSQKASSENIALSTVETLLYTVPAAVPLVAFLSGGQTPVEASQNLNAICTIENKKKPWMITFSFSRALQEHPLSTWGGNEGNKEKAQQIFLHRLKCNNAALERRYNESIESEV